MKIWLAIVGVALLLVPGPVLAGTKEGVAAFRTGEFETAAKELREPARAGDPEAQLYLARLYAAGLGGLARDQGRAAELYQQAANAGVPQAQHAYGVALALGDGVEQDMVEALKWFMLGAAAGIEASKQFGERIGRYMTRTMVRDARARVRDWESRQEAKQD